MSQNASDLLKLRIDDPASKELRRLALNIISHGVQSVHGGC